MRKLFSRLRFLPLTIFAATLMLTVKLGDIWDGIGDALDFGQAQAQTEQPAAAGEPPAQAPVDPAAAPPTATAGDASAAPFPPATPEQAAADARDKDAADRLIVDDPTLLSPAEIEILQRLAERRDELERRQRELEMREGLLQAAEQRIDGKIRELTELEQTIEGLIRKFDAQQEDKLLSLVKIYENMKPKDAARIFEDLEMTTLLEVAERMKERKLAPVIAAMSPEKAREVTVELKRLRELPGGGVLPPGNAGG